MDSSYICNKEKYTRRVIDFLAESGFLSFLIRPDLLIFELCR